MNLLFGNEAVEALVFTTATVATSDNEETVTKVAEQAKSVSEVKGITDDWTQSENLENSAEGGNSLTAEVPQASRSHKKTLITRKEDFYGR